MFRVVIPARYASQRFPGKPLARVGGVPMVLRVLAIAARSGADEVVVATDDERIRAACRTKGADVEMTSADHASGTDRIAEVARRRGWPDHAIVVNVQGDEPLLPPALVSQVASLLEAHHEAAVATLAVPVASEADYFDPNVVKVVCRDDGQALYFSRAPVPWDRDGGLAANPQPDRHAGARRHLGLYAYRIGALKAISSAPVGLLERRERLEQLRPLAMGLAIVVADAIEPPGPGVDTREDLARAEAILAKAAPE